MSIFRKTLITAGFVFAGFTVGAGAGVTYLLHKAQLTDSVWTLLKVATLVQSNYVDSFSTQQTKERLISGIVDSLDPHSTYLNSKDLAEMEERMRSAYGGIGITGLAEDPGHILVSDIQPKGPADQAGLAKGDKIIQVDGKTVKELGNKAFELIRGPIGSQVSLLVDRQSTQKTIIVGRNNIDVPTVQWTYVNDINGSKPLFIKARQFNEKLIPEITSILTTEFSLQKPPSHIILDLRDNPGGLVTAAVGLSALFLPLNEPVLQVRSNKETDTQTYLTQPEDWGNYRADPSDPILKLKKTVGSQLEHVPLYLLLNQNSASASELVAAALRDHKRATIVGTPSFGKGSVQTVLPLGGSDGAIKITTSRYYSPFGKSIQAQGVEPDVLVEDPDAIVGMREADLPGHLPAEQGQERKGTSTLLSKQQTEERFNQIKERQKQQREDISIFITQITQLPNDPVIMKIKALLSSKG